jgi:hypothetical protein
MNSYASSGNQGNAVNALPVDVGQTINFIVLWNPIAALRLNTVSLAFSSSNMSKMITVTNSGSTGSSLGWTASISYGLGANWLTLSSSNGTITNPKGTNASQFITVDADSSSLAMGTYTATITFHQVSSAPGQPVTPPGDQMVKVILRVPPPSPKCSLTADPTRVVFPGTATLTWGCTQSPTPTTCSLNGGPINSTVSPTGSTSTAPSGTTDYKISCTYPGNPAPITASSSVTVYTTGTGLREVNP